MSHVRLSEACLTVLEAHAPRAVTPKHLVGSVAPRVPGATRDQIWTTVERLADSGRVSMSLAGIRLAAGGAA